MKRTLDKADIQELDILCNTVRELAQNGDYDTCFKIITKAMESYPHSPEPHNLMGIIMERTGNHLIAMNHFRASWALDPTYLPASYNLNTYGTFFSSGKCAFDETDLPSDNTSGSEIVYDERGVGHIVSKRDPASKAKKSERR